MRSRTRKNYGITHSLTPLLTPSPPKLQQEFPQPPQNKYIPLFTKNTFVNPLTQRSKKHRLIQQKNTDIERQNRRLYQRLRKIKLKNAFENETKLENAESNPQQNIFMNTMSKPLSLPQVPNLYSFNKTKSQLNNILNDRKTFVSKYFQDLAHMQNKLPKKTQELGEFNCTGWKVKVLLLDDSFLVLRGRKGIKQLIKKYKWEKVKNKIGNGLQAWVKLKFQFQQ